MIISSYASDAGVGHLPSETLDVTNSPGKTLGGDRLSADTQVRGDCCPDPELSNSIGVSSSAKAISTVSDGNRYDPMANIEEQLQDTPIHTGDSNSLQDEPLDFPFLDPTEIQTDSEDDEDKNKSAVEGEPDENSRLPISSVYPRSFYSRCTCNKYGRLDHSARLWNSPCGPGCEFRPRFSDSWNSSRWGYRRHDRPPRFSLLEETGVGAGLYNIGNTCFLNAILQCFTHTVPLVKALRSSNHLMPCQRGIEGFCVACVLRNHIEHSISSSGKTISPSQLVDNLNKISSDFHRYQQEDAHEFLQCLLDKLERCCLDSTQKEETLSSQDDNIVQRVFGGRLVSKLQCCKCGHCSEKYESLIDLSLEIEDAETLQNALESFTKVEKIEDSVTKLKCDNCKEEVSMEKQLMLDRAPSVAALHLKRFKCDGSSIEKIGKPVDFSLELDLEPYSNVSKYSYDPQENLKYQLYGVVVHIGDSPTSGHYFCYVRSSPSTWHKLDDSMVVRVEEEMVLSEAAYILFYVKEDAPWFSSLMETQKDPNTSPKSVLDTVESECTAYPDLENSDTCKQIANGGDIQRTPLSSVPMVEDHNMIQLGINSDEIAAQKSFSSINPEARDSAPMNVASSLTAVENKNYCDDKVAAVHSEKINTGEVLHKIQRKDARDQVTPPGSPDPEIHVKQQPESRRKIRRDHPMVENAMMSKKLKKGGRDENARNEAVRYINKNFSSSRAMQLMAAMAPKTPKKNRLRSSPCKQNSPPGSRSKLMGHRQVLR